jgi:threonine/homoserine/homoserine lactone efflux protein
MSYDLLLAAAVFALVSSITPGPNNTMLMASGVNFGFKRTLWHMLGVEIGFGILLLSVGMGLHTVLDQYPGAYEAMRYAGAAYMLWIAWKLASAKPTQADIKVTATPMGFWAAVAFQWVNPKAWVMAVTCMSTYLAPHAGFAQVLLLAVLFVVVGSPSAAFWVGFGQAMRKWLQDPLRLRIFNIAMALALVASLYPMLNP